jgi:hypothetical protein
MRKGIEWVVSVLFAVILGALAAGILLKALSNEGVQNVEAQTVITEGCNNDNGCANNINGMKCIIDYRSDYEAFCGCLKNEDCVNAGGDVCGANQKCV